jgi:Leucine-rich repeat (LRR) protein
MIKQEQIDESLSVIARTADGKSYAYSTLNLSEKEIQELGDFLKPYIHLVNLNISQNDIRNVDTVADLTNLLNFSANQCAVSSLDFMAQSPQALQYLQWVDLSQNKIKELPALRQPQLTKLNLSENAITTCETFNGHARIMVLNLSKNKLTNCNGLSLMNQLEDLNLSENEIANTEDLKNMPQLKILNLNTNKLTTIAQLPPLPHLDTLDFGANTIEKPDCLDHLQKYPKLAKVNYAGNPLDEALTDGPKQEILYRLHPIVKVKSVNDDEVTQDDLDEWKAKRKERIRAEEQARKEAEEKAARGEEEGEKEEGEGEEAE